MNSFGSLIDKFSNKPNWKYSKGVLYFKRIAWIPICTEKDGVVFIYLSKQTRKEIFLILKELEGVEKYLISPIWCNPKYKIIDNDYTTLSTDYHIRNIENYLGLYVDQDFYFGFKKIGFDLISNMVKYCQKYDCFDLIKDVYDEINKTVQKETEDYYTGQKYYEFCLEIREDFSNMYRQIRLNQILN
jgi:hypothetical protein